MSTFNKILIAALIVQVGLAVLIRSRSDSGEAIRNPEPLLSGFARDQVTRVAIFDEPGKQEGDTPAIDLRREASGSEVSWKLASHHGYPARTGEVNELLDKLARLRTRGPVVTSQVRHKQLQVADDDYRRKLVVETGSSQITLYVGAPAGSRQVSVRLGGQDAVHQVGELSAAGVSTGPTSWVDTAYLSLPHDRVDYMAVRTQAGAYELQRGQRKGWTLVRDGQPYPVPAGKAFNVVAVDNWVKDAVRITLARPAEPRGDLDAPLATITLRMKPEAPPAAGGAGSEEQGTEAPEGEGNEEAGAGETEPAMSQGAEEYVIDIGAGDDSHYYVRLRGSPDAVMVRQESLRALVEMNDDVVMIPAEK